MKWHKFIRNFILWSLGLSLFAIIGLIVEVKTELLAPKEEYFSNPIFTLSGAIWFILVIFATVHLTRSLKKQTGKDPKWYIKALIFWSLTSLSSAFWFPLLTPILKSLISIL